MTMIENARLISFRSPAEPDSSGGETPGALTECAVPLACCIDQPTRTQLYRGGDKIVGLRYAMYVNYQPGLALDVDGQVTCRRYFNGIEQPEETLKISTSNLLTHRGESHYELLLSAI